jgi:HlyD family secretion protein
LVYQEANYNRVKALNDKKLVAESDYDLALYNYATAKANLKIAESGYDRAKINLDYATIYSPIDGVVLNRAVDEGQTVAASFSTPTLFSIANDLTQMQVAANIDETDIGQVKLGQRVEFKVNAYNGTVFNGKVSEIRLQSTTTSNVVTYTVIINAPNPDGKLLPGLTADITIYVQEASNILTIPLKATQFFPDSATIAGYLNSLPENQRPEFKKPEMGKRPGGMAFSKEKGMMKPGSMAFSPENAPKIVWIKTDKSIHPTPVEVGINDGVNTEVTKGLNEGDEVIVNISLIGGGFKPGAPSGSPFMPRPQQRTPAKK